MFAEVLEGYKSAIIDRGYNEIFSHLLRHYPRISGLLD